MKHIENCTLTVLTARSAKAFEILELNFTDFEASGVSDNVEDGVNLTSIEFPIADLGQELELNLATKSFRDNGISYSQYVTGDDSTSCESHYRVSEGEDNIKSWFDNEKDMVSTESVREALNEGGDTAVFELLDTIEASFSTPVWESEQPIAA